MRGTRCAVDDECVKRSKRKVKKKQEKNTCFPPARFVFCADVVIVGNLLMPVLSSFSPLFEVEVEMFAVDELLV